MSGRVLLAVLALLPLVVACERVDGLAPLTTGQQVGASAGGAVIVQRGDTAYSLSRRYNVPLRDLITVNGLQPPYMLAIGQRLSLPTSRQYIVQKGDTLYGISRMFNVDQSELTRVNNLQAPYGVQAGQPLRLPGESGGTEVAAAPIPLTPATPVPSGVGPGGTPLGGTTAPAGRPGAIESSELPPPGASASTPSVTATPLEAPTPLTKPSAGTGTGSAGTGQVAVMAPAAPVPAAPSAGGYEPGQAPTVLRPPAAKPVAPAQPAASAPPAVQEVVVAPPPKRAAEPLPPRSAGRFLWPVKGKLVSGYGPKPDGMHNDGLNITAPKGTTVIAADNGTVAYAGNELRGFGNLLLIKHADGWITAYAHLDRIDVERGATVKRGQAIATVGQTGSVTSPQLHFELRKGTQAVDPRDQMPPA